MDNKQTRGSYYSQFTEGTAEAVATEAAAGANRFHFITDVAGNADVDGYELVIRIGDTIKWQIGTLKEGVAFHHTFKTPISGSANVAAHVIVGSATSVCWANVSGYTI